MCIYIYIDSYQIILFNSYGVVFSLYVPYYCDIPRVAYTHVMGVPVTGKSLTYIIGLQVTIFFVISLSLVIFRLNVKNNEAHASQALNLNDLYTDVII